MSKPSNRSLNTRVDGAIRSGLTTHPAALSLSREGLPLTKDHFALEAFQELPEDLEPEDKAEVEQLFDGLTDEDLLTLEELIAEQVALDTAKRNKNAELLKNAEAVFDEWLTEAPTPSETETPPASETPPSSAG